MPLFRTSEERSNFCGVTPSLQLQTDTRGGKRKGFPGDVLFALMDLEEKHDIEFPHLKRQITSNWHTL